MENIQGIHTLNGFCGRFSMEELSLTGENSAAAAVLVFAEHRQYCSACLSNLSHAYLMFIDTGPPAQPAMRAAKAQKNDAE